MRLNKTTIIITVIISFILNTSVAIGQTIKGRVKDSKTNTPIPGATVRGVDSKSRTITDSLGMFTINHSGPIEVSVLGYQNLRLSPNSSFVEIALTSISNELMPIEVIGRIKKDYNSDYSFSATKIAIKNKDLPQGLSTVTKELMSDRGAFQLADAVKIAINTIFEELVRMRRGKSSMA